MNREEMEACLLELDEELVRAFKNPEPIQVLVVGGACLVFADVIDRPTKDIDVIITDLEGAGLATLVWKLTPATKLLRQLIGRVGKRHGFPPRERQFLNDDCAPFLLEIGELPPMYLFRAYKKLHLYLPTDLSYILACKLMAGRPGKDYDDIRALCEQLQVRTFEEAQRIVDRYFPEPADQRTHDLAATLADLFS